MNKQPQFSENYYNNHDTNGCTGTNLVNTTTASINYDWGNNAPLPGVPADWFCVQWSGSAAFAADWYTFFMVADDGVKLLIDNTTVLNKWFDQGPTLYSVSVPLTAGTHTITMRYYESTGGAVARLFWRRYNGMIGTYYDWVFDPFAGTGYGNPTMQRADAAVGFYWMSSSPLDTNEAAPFPQIQPDTFSIHWIGYITIPSSCRTVNFTTYSDDGILVDLYGTAMDRLVNQWNDHSLTAYSAQRSLCAGTYKLDASYYENGGDAGVRIVWN